MRVIDRLAAQNWVEQYREQLPSGGNLDWVNRVSWDSAIRGAFGWTFSPQGFSTWHFRCKDDYFLLNR